MRIAAAVSCLLLAIAPAAQAAPNPAALAEVDKIFADWSAAAHVPGVVYGIVENGELVYVKGQGVQDIDSKRPVGPQSLFRIASMSKAFTALAILKLRDEGKVLLDAPAETYVPELKAWPAATGDSPKITVRNLLTHSAGFVEDNPWGDRQQVLTEAEFTKLLADGVDFARGPGLAMEYSNLGYALLGRIITGVSGVRYQDYIRKEIMVPIGMGSTTYDIFASPKDRRAIGYRWQDNRYVREPDMRDGAFGAMGGVETSADDYWKWVAFLLQAWPARDGPEAGPVRRSTVREIVTGANFASGVQRPANIGGNPCRQAVAYGMAWRVVDDCDLGRIVTHTGGYPGYGSVVMLLPETGVGLFAFSSKTYGGASLPMSRAALALKASGYLKPLPQPVSPGLAAAYAEAKKVWAAGEITAAPLANNMLLDRDAAAWKSRLAAVKAETGACQTDAAPTPISAMEGRFSWTCEHGAVTGRVQRAPTHALLIQALDFTPATP